MASPSSTPAAGPSVAPQPQQAAPQSHPAAPQTEDEPEGRPRRRPWLIAIAAAALVVGLVAVAALAGRALLSGDDDEAVPSGPAPVEPVDGWSSTAEWVSPAVAKGKNSPVLVSGSTVITVTSTSRGPELTAMDADDGTRLWSSKIDGKLTGPPQLITHDDEPVVVAATENTLMRWSDLETEGENEPKTPETWDFTEAEVELVEGSPVPLLANEETVTALVLVGDELKKRTFPSDTTPVAADDKGRVTALRDSGHWYAVDHATRLPEATLLEPPMMGSLVRDVLGTVGSTVVVSWSAGGGTSRVVGYDMTASMKPLWETSVDGNPEPGSFTPSPDGDWAIVDTLAVDARTGETEQLPKKWKTLGMTGDRAWSRTHAVSNEGRVAELEDTVEDRDGLPVAVTSGGLGLVVAAEKGEARRIHALRPSS